MEIDIQKELEKYLEEAREINNQIQLVQQQKQALVRELFRVEGVVEFLNEKLGTVENIPADVEFPDEGIGGYDELS